MLARMEEYNKNADIAQVVVRLREGQRILPVAERRGNVGLLNR